MSFRSTFPLFLLKCDRFEFTSNHLRPESCSLNWATVAKTTRNFMLSYGRFQDSHFTLASVYFVCWTVSIRLHLFGLLSFFFFWQVVIWNAEHTLEGIGGMWKQILVGLVMGSYCPGEMALWPRLTSVPLSRLKLLTFFCIGFINLKKIFFYWSIPKWIIDIMTSSPKYFSLHLEKNGIFLYNHNTIFTKLTIIS